MKRLMLRAAVFVSVIGLAGPQARAEAGEKYNEMMKAPAVANTFKSLATLVMASPYDGQMVEQSLWKFWWANQEDAELREDAQALAAAQMRQEIAAFERVVQRHDVRQLALMGMSVVGTKRNLDMYMAGDTAAGPVIFRASVSLGGGEGSGAAARVFAIKTFEGWDECREAMNRIHHRAGDTVASMTYKPRRPPEPDEATER